MPLQMEIAKAFVSVGANVSQLESALDKVKKELSGFTEEAAAKAEGGGTSAFAGLGKQLAGALLTGWAAMKVKDVIMGQLEEIGKAANIQARLNVQLGGLDEANKAMQSLRTLSIDTGNSLSTLTETFLSMSKAGQSAQEALDFTKQAATLARISGDLAATAQIADNLNNIMGAYGQELGNVANLSDKLAVASTKTQGALEGLTQNLQLAAPVAKDVNVTFDQLVAVLSTVMNAGMESGRAVTSLLGVFTELQQLKLTELPKKWEEVLASLGDGAKAAVESFKQGEISALELIQRLGEAGAGATEFAHLFGNMGARVATIVKDDLLAANSSIADTERALKNASGAAQRAADTMANTLPAAWERIKNTFLNLFTGPEMQEAFAPITNVINTLADSLATLAKGGIPNIVVELFGSEDGAKQFMETMRQLAGEVMSSVGTVFKELWEVLKHIVPVIADLFSLLRDLGVFQAFRVAIEAISKSIQVIVDIIGALVKVLRGDWAGAWEVAGKALQGVFGIFDKVISFIQTIGEGIQRVIEGIFGVQRATRSEAAATAEEEKQMVVTQQLQASLEKLPERIHQAIKEFPDIAKKLDESKALQAMMQFIEVEYRKGTARATDIGAALYDALRAAGLTDLAEKLAKTFAASPLKGKQKGGLVEGTGRGDVVRTALEPGEFVITRAAVRKYGVNFLEAINSGQFSVGAGLGKLLMEVGADIISTYGARFQTGGMVPGTGSGDRVPALLEPGEFVLRKDAVRALGLSTVEALNRAGAMRFQTGGLVPPISGLSVADVAGIVERTGQWWVPYRLMSAELTQTLLKKNPALFRENLLKALVWGIMHVQERVATAERMFETFFGGRVPTTQEIAKALGMSREALLQKVRSPMPDAEAKAFAERVRALYPNFPKKLGTTKVPGIIGAIGLVEDLNLEEFMSKDVAGKMQMIMDNVKGLGPAKSSFALASLGIDDIATLDTWMQKTVLKPALERIASLPDEELAKLGYTRAEALKKISDIERKGQTSWKGVSDYLRDVRAAFGDIATSGTKQWEAYWNILEGGKLQSASVSFRQSSHLPFFKELGISKEAAAQKYAIDVGKADSALMRSLASGTLPLNLSIGGLGLIGDRVGTSLGDMISILSDFDRVYQIRLGQSIQGLEDIVTRHLEYATIYGGRNGQIIEVFGSAADEAKIRTLASELAQKSDVALSIIDKAGGRSTHYLRGQVFAGGAGFAEAPGSAIRLYTQNMGNLEELARKYFGAGKELRFLDAKGVWQGGGEFSKVIEILRPTTQDLALATELAREINAVNNQTATLLAALDTTTHKWTGRLITERPTEFTKSLAAKSEVMTAQSLLSYPGIARLGESITEHGMSVSIMDELLRRGFKTEGLEFTGAFFGKGIMQRTLMRMGETLSESVGRIYLDRVGASAGTLVHEFWHGLEYEIYSVLKKQPPSGWWERLLGEAFKEDSAIALELARISHQIRKTFGIEYWDKKWLDYVDALLASGKVKPVSEILKEFPSLLTSDPGALAAFREFAPWAKDLPDSQIIGRMANAAYEQLHYTLSPSELWADYGRAWHFLDAAEMEKMAPRATQWINAKVWAELGKVSPSLLNRVQAYAARFGKSLVGLAFSFFLDPLGIMLGVMSSDAERILAYLVAEKGMTLPGYTWGALNYGITYDENGVYFFGERVLTAEEYKKLPEKYLPNRYFWGMIYESTFKPLLALVGLTDTTFEELLRAKVEEQVNALYNDLVAQFGVERAGEILKDALRGPMRGPAPKSAKTIKAPLRKAMGGLVPGVGVGDVVPALLEPGEFVIRKDVVQRLGLSFFQALNRFQKGGLAGEQPMPDIYATAPTPEPTLAMSKVTVGGVAAGGLAATPMSVSVGDLFAKQAPDIVASLTEIFADVGVALKRVLLGVIEEVGATVSRGGAGLKGGAKAGMGAEEAYVEAAPGRAIGVAAPAGPIPGVGPGGIDFDALSKQVYDLGVDAFRRMYGDMADAYMAALGPEAMRTVAENLGFEELAKIVGEDQAKMLEYALDQYRRRLEDQAKRQANIEEEMAKQAEAAKRLAEEQAKAAERAAMLEKIFPKEGPLDFDALNRMMLEEGRKAMEQSLGPGVVSVLEKTLPPDTFAKIVKDAGFDYIAEIIGSQHAQAISVMMAAEEEKRQKELQAIEEKKQKELQAIEEAKRKQEELQSAWASTFEGFVGQLFGPLTPLLKGPIDLLAKGAASLLGDFEILGVSALDLGGVFFNLLTRSEGFRSLMEELEPIIQAVADALGLLLAPITAFVKWIRELLGIKKKTEKKTRMPGAMNIPSGFKNLERLRFAATAPGMSPEAGGGQGGGFDLGKLLINAGIVGIVVAGFIDLMNAITGQKSFIGGIIGGVGKFFGGLFKKGLPKGIAALSKGFDILSGAIGFAQPVLRTLEGGWQKLSRAIGGAGSWVAGLIVGKTKKGLDVLADLGQWLLEKLQEALGGITAVGNVVLDVTGQAIQWALDGIQFVGNVIFDITGQAIQWALDAIRFVGNVLFDVTGQAIQWALDAIKFVGNVLFDVTGQAIQWALSAIRFVGNVLFDVTGQAIQWALDAIKFVGNVFFDITGQAIQWALSAIRFVGNVLFDVTGQAIQWVLDAIKFVGNVIFDVTGQAIQWALSAISVVGNLILDITGQAFQLALSAIKIVGNVVLEAASLLWNAAGVVLQLTGTVALDALAVAWDLATDVLAGAGDLLLTGAQNAWNAAMAVIGGAGNVLIDITKAAWNTLMGGLSAIGSWLPEPLKSAWNSAVSAISGAGNALLDMLKGGWNSVVNVIASAGNALLETLKAGWNTAVNVIASAGNALLDIAKAAWQTAMNAITQGGAALLEVAKGAWNTVMNGVSAAVNAFVDIAKGAWNAVMNGVSAAVNAFVDIAKGAWNLVMNGVSAAVNAFVDIAKGAWNLVMNGVSAAVNAFVDIAKGAWNLVMNGVSAAVNAFVDIAKGAWNLVMNGVSAAVNAFVDIAKGAWNLVMNGVSAAVNAFVDIAKGAWNLVMNGVSAAVNAFVDIAKGAWNLVMNGVSAAASAFVDIAKGAWNLAMSAIASGANLFLDIAKGAFSLALSALGGVYSGIIEPAFRAIAGGLNTVWGSILQPAFGAVASGVGSVFSNVLGPAFGAVGNAIGGAFSGFLQGPISALAGGIGSAFSNFLGPAFAAVAGPLGAAFPMILEGAFRALGIDINKVFGDILKPAFDFVASGLKAVWENVVKPVWDAIAPALKAIWDALKPIWDMIIAGLKVAWDLLKPVLDFGVGILKTGFEAIAAILNVISAGLQAAWNVLKPVWDMISAGLKAAWDAVKAVWDAIKVALAAAWDAVKTVWGTVAAGLKAVWENVLKPVWDAIAVGLKVAWDAVKAVWDAIKVALGAAWDAVKAVWNTIASALGAAWNGVKAVWDSIKAGLGTVWDGVKGAFNAIASGLNWIKDNVLLPVFNALGGVFETLKTVILRAIDVLKAPINGLIAVWNGIIGTLANIELPLIGKPFGFLSGLLLPYLQTGGEVQETGVAVVHKGEQVINPAMVRVLKNLNRTLLTTSRPNPVLLSMPRSIKDSWRTLATMGEFQKLPMKPITMPDLLVRKDNTLVRALEGIRVAEPYPSPGENIIIQGNLIIDDENIVNAIRNYLARKNLDYKGVRTGVV